MKLDSSVEGLAAGRECLVDLRRVRRAAFFGARRAARRLAFLAALRRLGAARFVFRALVRFAFRFFLLTGKD